MDEYKGPTDEVNLASFDSRDEIGPKELILGFVSKDQGVEISEKNIWETFTTTIKDNDFLILGLSINNRINYYGAITKTVEGKTLHRFMNSSHMAKELLGTIDTAKYLENPRITKINEYNGDKEVVITDGNTTIMIPEKGEPYKHAMSD